MKVYGYTRVSSQEQVNGTSLDSQQEMIRAYCTLKGFSLNEMFVDSAVSGSIPMGERPAGKILIESLERGSIVVMVKLDRGFRDTVDCLQTVNRWEALGVNLHVIDMGGNAVDVSSASGRFMLTVLVAAAEMERNRINERCQSGREATKAAGKRTGELRYGYTLGLNNQLVPVESEQRTLQTIKTLRSNGLSYRRCAERLNGMGIPSKKGGSWAGEQIRSILSHTV